MFGIFENRNKGLASLIKMSDYLGHSLRENVLLFDVNSAKNRVMYLTESKKIISADYEYEKNNLKLVNLSIHDSSLFEYSDTFDDLVRSKVDEFVGSLFESNYSEASINFSDVLELWRSQVKYGALSDKLTEKAARFNKTHSIIDEDSIQQVLEVIPQLVEYLSENKDAVLEIPEIRNGIKLSNVVSQAFNLPKISYEVLAELKEFSLPANVNESVYEIICNQELIKQELLESKKSFDTVWATSDKIKSLAQKIYESNENIVIEALAEAFEEVPFIALASKKQLSTTITNALNILDTKVNRNDVTSFVATLFEMKKPLKTELLVMINERYGINAQNLNETPSFKSLLNTQVVIFEALSRICPKKSIIKTLLHEAAQTLKVKNGVESVDINTLLMAIFEEAGYLEDLDVDSAFEVLQPDSELFESEEISTIVNKIKESIAPASEEEIIEAEVPEAPTAKDAPISGDTELEGEDDTDPTIKGDEEASLMGMPDTLTKEDFIKNRADLEEILSQLIDTLNDVEDEEDAVEESTQLTEEEDEEDEEEEDSSSKVNAEKKLKKSLKKKAAKKKAEVEDEEDSDPEDPMYNEETNN